VGGLWAKVFYDWLFVDLLFVPQAFRGQDLGRRLMAEAERAAVERGLVGVWLDTHSFQAPGFYETLGYEAFGSLPDYPRGETRTFYRKML
jgi:GNAT superfamily N-acetyltransferase